MFLSTFSEYVSALPCKREVHNITEEKAMIYTINCHLPLSTVQSLDVAVNVSGHVRRYLGKPEQYSVTHRTHQRYVLAYIARVY